VSTEAGFELQMRRRGTRSRLCSSKKSFWNALWKIV